MLPVLAQLPDGQSGHNDGTTGVYNTGAQYDDATTQKGRKNGYNARKTWPELKVLSRRVRLEFSGPKWVLAIPEKSPVLIQRGGPKRVPVCTRAYNGQA